MLRMKVRPRLLLGGRFWEWCFRVEGGWLAFIFVMVGAMATVGQQDGVVVLFAEGIAWESRGTGVMTVALQSRSWWWD